MVCYSLKTFNKLEEVEEKEKQIEKEHATNKAAANLSYTSTLEADPFAKIEVPLLLPKV
jgi:hypothetical protein